MEAFFARVAIRVLADERVQVMLHGLIKEAIHDSMNETINQIDVLDGKMGNMQEQLVNLPGQMIGSVTQAVEQAIRNFNPFR